MQLTPTQQLTFGWSALAALLALALWLLGPVLMPFVVGAVLAYALHPLVQRLRAWGLPLVLAVLLTEVLLICLIVALVMLVVPILAHELPRMRAELPGLIDALRQRLTPWLAQWGVNIPLDWAALRQMAAEALNLSLQDGLAQALASLRIGGSVALSVLGNLVLIPVVLFYLLLDWQRFVRHIEALVPLPLRGDYDSFVQEADAVLGQYLRGQFSVMAVLALYYSLALAAFGLDLAVPIGVFTGLAMFVPYLGFGLGLLLAALAAILSMPVGEAVLCVAVVYGFGQLLESFFLTPRLVGERIGLNPLMVIFALLTFGQLFGFVGVLVALPLAAVLLVGVRRLRARYQASRLYTGH